MLYPKSHVSIILFPTFYVNFAIACAFAHDANIDVSLYALMFCAFSGDHHEQTTLSNVQSKQAQLLNPQVAECAICFSPAESSNEVFQLSCAHTFCCDCWRNYLTHSILDEGKRKSLRYKFQAVWQVLSNRYLVTGT